MNKRVSACGKKQVVCFYLFSSKEPILLTNDIFQSIKIGNAVLILVLIFL